MIARWFSEYDFPQINRNLSRWAFARIYDRDGEFEKCCTMGVFDGETLCAVMVYYDYDPEAGVVQISGAADDSRWLKRHILREMFSGPFERMGCQMVVMRVGDDDTPLHRMLTTYGFNCYTIPRLRGRNEDELIFTLTDDDWRTNKFNIRSSDGQEITTKAA